MVSKIADFLIAETTTFGVRWQTDHRMKAHREIRTGKTTHGGTGFKVAKIGDRTVNCHRNMKILNVWP